VAQGLDRGGLTGERDPYRVQGGAQHRGLVERHRRGELLALNTPGLAVERIGNIDLYRAGCDVKGEVRAELVECDGWNAPRWAVGRVLLVRAR